MVTEARAWVVRSAWAALVLAGAPIAAADESGIRTPPVPGGEPPAVLQRVVVEEALLAFAISADGQQAALAAESTARAGQSELRLFSTALDEPRSTRLPGRVRDLLFATDGSVLYGILHRVAKRTGGDTHLVLIDPATLKMKRANRLPVDATDLDHWVTSRALLIAAPSEIRTLLLPDLRSGPLFAVAGSNRVVAALGGGSLVLVGQEDRLELIDLEDRPGIDAMPVREQLRTAGPVDGLAAAGDGKSALARLADGRLYTVEVDPLRLRPAGSGSAVAAPPVARVMRTAERRSAEHPPVTPVESAEIPPAPPSPTTATPLPTRVEERRPADAPSPTEPTASGTASTPAPVPAPAPAAPPEGAAPRASAPTAKTTPPAETPVKEPAGEPGQSQPSAPPPRATAHSDAQVSGRLTGAAVAGVRFVVLRGPNNLLREAARVTPSADGTWEANGLDAGRYRVQLDGGGGRVLVSRPPYLILDITDGQRILAADLEVLREF